MPTTDAGFYDHGDLLGRDMLALFGPTIDVNIGLDAEYKPGVPGRPDLPDHIWPALVDTGAAISCIASAVAIDLGLPVVDRKDIAGAHGAHPLNVHVGQIYVPILERTLHGVFHGVHLRSGGSPHAALVGRDFLRHFTMVYEGRTGLVTIGNDEDGASRTPPPS